MKRRAVEVEAEATVTARTTTMRTRTSTATMMTAAEMEMEMDPIPILDLKNAVNAALVTFCASWGWTRTRLRRHGASQSRPR